MKKYILISKDNKNGVYQLYESDDYRFIHKKYKIWRDILSSQGNTLNVYILCKIE